MGNKMFKKVFMVWDKKELFWNQFESVEDAVSSEGDGVDVYVVEPKFLGRFKRKAELVKINNRKRR